MIRVFPIAAPATLTNSFGDARSGHPHQGNDIFADVGAPLVAVDEGQVRSGVDPLGGNVLNLFTTDGARYYYAHLDAFADGSGVSSSSPPAPRMVRIGDLIGFVGKTGNAAATQPHLHFEAHPGNGPAVDPFPALQQAPRLEQPNPTSTDLSTSSSARTTIAKLAGLTLLAGAAWALLYPSDARALATRLGLT